MFVGDLISPPCIIPQHTGGSRRVVTWRRTSGGLPHMHAGMHGSQALYMRPNATARATLNHPWLQKY